VKVIESTGVAAVAIHGRYVAMTATWVSHDNHPTNRSYC